MHNVKLAVLNPGGTIVSASQGFCEFFGNEVTPSSTSVSDILNLDLAALSNGKADHRFPGVPIKSQQGGAVDCFLHTLKGPDRKVIAHILTISGTGAEGIPLTDEHLCHLDRLTHIGKLSASIAHEIGNPLGGILAAARGLKKKLTSKVEEEYLDMIIEDIGSIKSTIESLRDFARRSKPNMAPCDLRDILRRTLRLVQPEMEKKKIVFSESYPDGDLSLSADPEQLRQVFLNILLNAVAAVGQGGSISLTVDAAAKDKKVYHVVTIRDSGAGMLPEEAANLFKPFYTTKAKGLGLGLHVTKKIVDDHDGSIEVDSKKGEGTSFRVLLFKERKA